MDSTPASLPTILRCDPLNHKLVLALAAQAWPEAERPAHWHAISELLAHGRAEDVILLGAQNGARFLAAILAQVLVGKTAVVWPPQFAVKPGDAFSTIATSLFAGLDRELAARGVCLAQALIAPEQQAVAELLKLGGFEAAAELLYLAAPRECFPEQALTLPFQLEAFHPAASARLIRLIERTYRGTLDCPRLDGLRETADVVLGYQAVGEFQPELWQIARHEGEDVGCLLVNMHPELKQAEIVYAGLVPEVRGRGWGLALTKHAQWLARVAECEQAVLAVDAENGPAIQMYSAAGFTQWDRKAVWLRTRL